MDPTGHQTVPYLGEYVVTLNQHPLATDPNATRARKLHLRAQRAESENLRLSRLYDFHKEQHRVYADLYHGKPYGWFGRFLNRLLGN